MYQCESCRRTFYQQSATCPHCGVRFGTTRTTERLLPTRDVEYARKRRSKQLKRLKGALFMGALWSLVWGGGLGALIGWIFGYGALSGAKVGAIIVGVPGVLLGWSVNVE
jgi:hypothetical protein